MAVCASPRAPPAPSASAIGSPVAAADAATAIASALVIAQRQGQQRARLRAPRLGLDDLGVAAVVQPVHQQLARRAVGNFQLVASVGEIPPLWISMPVNRKRHTWGKRRE